MKKSTAKMVFLQDSLLNWFEINQRIFPWRKQKMSSYDYIIAEILLQRTKAETISKYYLAFISKYPDWKSINNDSEGNIANFLKPIGLYKQRSSRLKKLAYEMVLMKNKLPNQKDELSKIPFFGQYIVNSILLFIFNKPAPLLDVNMARVLERYFGKRKLADIRYDPYLQALAHEYVNHDSSKELNWAILDFSALICQPKPNCLICPVNSRCLYFKADLPRK